eukprot:3242235-Rhodomonas_salina.1
MLGLFRAFRPPRVHPKIKCKKPQFQYNLYQECGFLDLISGADQRVGQDSGFHGVQGPLITVLPIPNEINTIELKGKLLVHRLMGG